MHVADFTRIIRHPKTDFNEGLEASRNGDHRYFTEGKFTTDQAVQVNNEGRLQYKVASKNHKLREFAEDFDSCFASEMIRTQQGASIFGYTPDIISSDYNERSWGKLTSLPYNERGNFDDEYDRDAYRACPPGGESNKDVVNGRVSTVDKFLKRDFAGKKVIIFGHGDWMRCFIAKKFGMSQSMFNYLFQTKHPLLTVLNGQMIDFSHVDPVSGEVDYTSMWFRSVALTDLTRTDNTWHKIR